jgi:hypothetical protein
MFNPKQYHFKKFVTGILFPRLSIILLACTLHNVKMNIPNANYIMAGEIYFEGKTMVDIIDMNHT